jgi:hypothetical protein
VANAHPSIHHKCKIKAKLSIAHTVVMVTFQTQDSRALGIGLPTGSLPCSVRV